MYIIVSFFGNITQRQTWILPKKPTILLQSTKASINLYYNVYNIHKLL